MLYFVFLIYLSYRILNGDSVGDVATGGFRGTQNLDDLATTKAVVAGHRVIQQDPRQLSILQATKIKEDIRPCS